VTEQAADSSVIVALTRSTQGALASYPPAFAPNRHQLSGLVSLGKQNEKGCQAAPIA
jgi:hypothetical protein